MLENIAQQALGSNVHHYCALRRSCEDHLLVERRWQQDDWKVQGSNPRSGMGGLRCIVRVSSSKQNERVMEAAKAQGYRYTPGWYKYTPEKQGYKYTPGWYKYTPEKQGYKYTPEKQ